MSFAAFDLSITAAAELIGVNPATLRRWADDGKIGCWRSPNGQRRFRRSDIDAFIERHSSPAAEAAS